MDWEWSQLVDLTFTEGHLAVSVGPVVWIALGVLVLVLAAWRRPWSATSRSWRVTKVSVAILSTTWEIERNRLTAKLAHEAYIELVTRKAAMKFDERHDVIAEIYNSWYELFGEIRRLARQLDPDEMGRNKDLQQLHDLLITVLNRGLRPHLTRWQASFRRWYDAESERRPTESPQEIQRRFPEYDELVGSLRDANCLVLRLTEDLRRLWHT